MKLIKKDSLIYQVYVLFFFLAILTLSSMFTLYCINLRALKSQKLLYAENITANIVQNTEDILSSASLMSETVSNASYTATLLTENYIPKKNSVQTQLNRLISKLINTTPHISNILLLDAKDNVYSFSSFDYSLAGTLDDVYGIYDFASSTEGFSDALYLQSLDTTYYVSSQTISEASSNIQPKFLGKCIIICSSDSLNRICQNASTSDNTLIAILDKNNQIIASNQDRTTSDGILASMNNDNYLILNKDIASGWNLVYAIPNSELFAELNSIRYLTIFLLLLITFAFLLLNRHMNTKIIHPLLNIVHFFQQGPYYTLHNKLTNQDNNEITVLTTNINQMLEDISELTHTVLANQARLYEVELSEAQTKFFALRAQINPHFLYNTLNTVQELNYEMRQKDIKTTVSCLSFLMRYSLNDNNTASIKEEFRCIDKYLQIMKIRYPDCFIYSCKLEDSLSEHPMPRFLLQPLVENAIIHGLLPNERKGNLSLSASLLQKVENGSLLKVIHLECKDDGIGIPPDKLNDLRDAIKNATAVRGSKSDDHSEIGLQNINMRVKLLYGDAYGLSIYRDDPYTIACIDFPYTSEPSFSDISKLL